MNRLYVALLSAATFFSLTVQAQDEWVIKADKIDPDVRNARSADVVDDRPAVDDRPVIDERPTVADEPTVDFGPDK